MELSGNTLRNFWIWYLLPEQRKTYKTDSLIGKNPAIKIRFVAMSFTERYGVYVDYFDSVKISLEIQNRIIGWNNKDIEYRPCYTTQKGIHFGIHFKTRPEARTAAIEKANELRNEELNK
tara:strand:- start:132 stop:491 length:360 start_codon:yes stop_codon:yes gene_type:complete